MNSLRFTVLHQKIQKFFWEIIVCYLRKIASSAGRGGGIIYFHHLSSLDYHEFLQRVFICVSSGFSLPSVFFPHEGILDAVDFLDHHITHRRYEQLFHLFEFP